MRNEMALDILILLIVVFLIWQKLWKSLGSDAHNVHRVKLSRESAEKLYNILKNEAEKGVKNTSVNAGELTPIDDENLSESEKMLRQIPEFNKDLFIKGAKKAFELITSAFNNADKDTLKMLVSPDICKKMAEIIKQRKEEKITAETDFIGFDKVEIAKVNIENGKALISVEFVSEQVNVLRGENGEVIQGDENYIQSITDVWTFERSLNAKTSNWVLVSTKK